MKQMKEATDRARSIAQQLNVQMTLYPEGYTAVHGTKVSEEHQKQFKQQKEV